MAVLGIGTAQFGLDYGQVDPQKAVPREEAGRILRLAASAGARVIDTSSEYGQSERSLGESLWEAHPFRVVTKALFQDGDLTAHAVEDALAASLRKLKASSVDGFLFHRARDLEGARGARLFEQALALKKKGLVRKIGVSVYAEEPVLELAERFPLDLVQLPLSLFDQRLLRGGALAQMKRRGIEIHARSVFLQGLLLADPDKLSGRFAKARPLVVRYRQALEGSGLSPLAAALGFVADTTEVDAVICGVNSAAQLEEITAAWERSARLADPGRFAVEDASIVNPALWGSAP